MKSRYGTKGMAMLLATLGVMAMSAAVAQASTGSPGLFLVGNQSVTGLHSIQGEQVGSGELLSEIGIDIECQGGEVESGSIHPGGVVSGAVLFHECVVLENPVCTPYPSLHDLELETNHGLILASGHGRVVLHGGEHYLTVLGNPIFTTMFIGDALGELGECGLEDNHFTVAGGVAFLINDPLTSQGVHRLKALLNGSLLLQTLFFFGGTSELHGEGDIAILGGVNWAVH